MNSSKTGYWKRFLEFLNRIIQRIVLSCATAKNRVASNVLGPLRMALTKKCKQFSEWGGKMIGAMEKGIEAAKLSTPPAGTYEGIDLTTLPKFICFKAAVLKSQTTFQYVIIALSVVFCTYAVIREYSFLNFMHRYRLKEYILAPGVMDFTKASPQTVSEHYVNDAVMDFLSQLGNVNPTNIDEQYRSLSRFMSPQLSVKFQMEVSDWVEQVKENKISQILEVTQKEITSDDHGHYKVVALARAEFYSQDAYLGHENQAVEMRLELVPPKSGTRWYLQITHLNWNKIETFKVKKSLEEGVRK